MMLRFKIAYDNGTIKCAVGETADVQGSLAHRLVRSGVAEEITGNAGIAAARRAAGMPPRRRGTARSVATPND